MTSKQTAGFTLIELLLVVALAFVLAGATSAFSARFLLSNQVDSLHASLVGQARKARTYATSGKRGGSWGIHYGSQTVTLFLGTSYASRTAGFDETISVPSSVTVSGLSEVVFAHATGAPSATPTITLSNSLDSRSLTINALGVTQP